MASDKSSDYGWDTDLDEDVHALLDAAAESIITEEVDRHTSLEIRQSASTSTHTHHPPAPVSAPSHAATIRNDVLSQPRGAEAEAHDDSGDDDVDDGDVGAVLEALAVYADEKLVNLDGRDRDRDSVQGIPNTLGTGQSRRAAGAEVAYPDLSRMLTSMGPGSTKAGTAEAAQQQPQPPPPGPPAPLAPDLQSPLARFRSYPKKPLSVSDLTSGAWCEVQYEYTLTRLPGGRRTRTAAMKGGTRVHTRLEEEVHTTVRVDVTTREDHHGIKLWNVITGLRTLRETGLTRELEIWGIIPGEAAAAGASDDDMGPQLVNGIIDALSYHNPDPAFEELLESNFDMSQSQSQSRSQASAGPASPAAGPAGPAGPATPAAPAAPVAQTPRKRGRPKSPATPSTASPNKSRITDFFASQTRPRTPATPNQGGPSTAVPAAAPPPPPPPAQPHRRIYITDIKTRSTDRLPTGMAVRPTKVQLFLYHRFLCDLAAGKLDFDFVFRRYGLNQDAPFSDRYMAQLGAAHDVLCEEPGGLYEISREIDFSGETARYRTLRTLVALLKREVALTFPHGADSIGSIVAVEYRMRARTPPPPPDIREEEEEEDDDDERDDNYDPDAGRCIGTNVIPVDEGLLERYLGWYMAWWRGQRPAVGVQIEEVGYKCRMCEFGDDCEWRIAKAEEHKQRVRAARGQAA